MPPHSPPSPPVASPRLPTPVLDAVEALSRRGFQSWWVGEGLREALCGHPFGSYEICTEAPAQALLKVFARSVPTRPDGAAFALPTAAGPVDLWPLSGRRLEDALGRRDFSIHAMAWAPQTGTLLDPHGGQPDLASGRLRMVGDAADRLRESPLRALRAARLCAEAGFVADPALEVALRDLARKLPRMPALPARSEIYRLLLAPRASAGLTLLRRTGLEAALVRGVRSDAAQLVDALPARLLLRLSAWLLGSRASPLLRRLRTGLDRAESVLRVLHHHPLERSAAVRSAPALRRLLRRLTEAEFEALRILRQAELDLRGPDADADRRALEAFVDATSRLRSQDAIGDPTPRLALGGRDVMEALARGPGRHIGRALDFLAEEVRTHPECNTRDELRERLQRWAQKQAP